MFRTTWRQLLRPEHADHLTQAATFTHWRITQDQLDDEISREAYITWSSRDLVVGRVCAFLKSLDLGTDINRPGSVGGIRFARPRHKMACGQFAYCDDLLSVSLLQARLNELGTGIKVEWT